MLCLNDGEDDDDDCDDKKNLILTGRLIEVPNLITTKPEVDQVLPSAVRRHAQPLLPRTPCAETSLRSFSLSRTITYSFLSFEKQLTKDASRQ